MVIYQRPLSGTLIAQPVVFDDSLLLPRTDVRRRRCTWFCYPFGFYQEQFALSESQKWLATLIVCTPA